MVTNDPTPLVFLSHSHKQKQLAKAIRDLLQKTIGLKGSEIRCTSSGQGFRTGSHLDATSQHEAASARVFLCLITEDAAQSPHVRAEIESRLRSDGKRILPILGPGAAAETIQELRQRVARRCDDENELLHLVEDVARDLGRALEPSLREVNAEIQAALKVIASSQEGVHVVLGSGGVRVAAYVGALRVLDGSRRILSISGNSAGAFIAGLYASGVRGEQLTELMERYRSARLLKDQSLFFRFVRWPYNRYARSEFPQAFEKLVGRSLTFGETVTPLAMSGLDLVTGRFLAYSSKTHPTMPIRQALQVAIAVPGLLPPVEDKGRIMVDAAIATACPIWLPNLFGDPTAPIVALTVEGPPTPEPPRRLEAFLNRLFYAAVTASDDIQYRVTDRVCRVRIVTAVRDLIAPISAQEHLHLVEEGATQMTAALSAGLPRVPKLTPEPEDSSSHHAAARTAAKNSIIQFAKASYVSSYPLSNSPAAVMAVQSSLDNVQDMVEHTSKGSPDEQMKAFLAEVEKLRREITAALAKHPEESAVLAKKLEEATQAATATELSILSLKVSKDGLLSAAEAVAKVMPKVLASAHLIANSMAGMR
jgi:predicted acylesterase/phospholipase RssA